MPRPRAPQQLSAAERKFARNKARIESGETFRGQKPLGVAAPSLAVPALGPPAR